MISKKVKDMLNSNTKKSKKSFEFYDLMSDLKVGGSSINAIESELILENRKITFAFVFCGEYFLAFFKSKKTYYKYLNLDDLQNFEIIDKDKRNHIEWLKLDAIIKNKNNQLADVKDEPIYKKK